MHSPIDALLIGVEVVDFGTSASKARIRVVQRAILAFDNQSIFKLFASRQGELLHQ